MRLECATCAKLTTDEQTLDGFGYQAATLKAAKSAVRDCGLSGQRTGPILRQGTPVAALLWILILLAVLSLPRSRWTNFSGHTGGCGRKWYMVLVGAAGRPRKSLCENWRLYRIRARLQSCRERPPLPSALGAVGLEIRP